MDSDLINHSSISLYFTLLCPQGHRLRMVLAEKDIVYKPVLVRNPKKLSEDMAVLNPAGIFPLFVDRSLTLTDPMIASEYLDERFPYPPLMPVDPAMRARLKAAARHIDHIWFECLRRSVSTNKKTSSNAIKELEEDIVKSVGLFASNKFFLSDEITLVDCSISVILWHLPRLGIKLSQSAIVKYQKRLFMRPGFRRSLTEDERDINPEYKIPE